MACERCGADFDATAPRHPTFSALEARGTWCADCEHTYDEWSRRHASDIVWQSLTGMVVVVAVGLGLPMFAVSPLVGGIGAFVGFGTMVGLMRLTRRRRRQQFLQASLPRAYLTAPRL